METLKSEVSEGKSEKVNGLEKLLSVGLASPRVATNAALPCELCCVRRDVPVPAAD